MTENPFSIAGKHILINGANSGIGSAFARHASQAGARLCLMGRNEEKLEELASGLHNASVASADITGIDGFKACLLEVVGRVGPFDGVFHAAGNLKMDSIRRLSDTDFDVVMGASLKGAAAILSVSMKKAFLNDGGSIVLMSSASSARPQSGLALYSASKAAIDALVRSACAELAARDVRVNSIVAGAVWTSMLEKSLQTMPAASAKAFEQSYVLGFGAPEDVVLAGIYLLSDAARWVTGTGLVVDGGFLA